MGSYSHSGEPLLRALRSREIPGVAAIHRADGIGQRAGVIVAGIGFFIDGANLSISWRGLSRAQIDFAALRCCVEELCGGTLAEAYCFDATENSCPNGSHRAMGHCGISAKRHEYAYEHCRDAKHERINDANGFPIMHRVQKGVDVGLVTYMLDSHRRAG